MKRKVIVFTRFSRMALILHRELSKWSPVLVTGKDTLEQRSRAYEHFSNNDECRLLVTTEASAQGINLQAASVVYNYDLPFSVGKLIQRAGRAARIGQTKPVLVVNLVTEGTVERHVADLLTKKITLARDLIDNEHIFTTLDQVKQALQG